MNSLEKHAAKRLLLEKMASLGLALKGGQLLDKVRRGVQIAKRAPATAVRATRGARHGVRSGIAADKAGRVVANKVHNRTWSEAAKKGPVFRHSSNMGKRLYKTTKNPVVLATAGASAYEGSRRAVNAAGGTEGIKNRLKNAWEGLKNPRKDASAENAFATKVGSAWSKLANPNVVAGNKKPKPAPRGGIPAPKQPAARGAGNVKPLQLSLNTRGSMGKV